ncbi:hypothetical protein RAH46_21385 [Pseudomonas entomophila]|uniref:Uncharacterized protein n=1 Tax=Pseudomonas entomophila TaxID=312306 RepID=A0ABY9QN71_9PSED|nr:hypothetical protein [Pseudomonas entomophila]WMW04854.1 hypothetical protein RAH46_21385 [Pseudomonas entomophila]
MDVALPVAGLMTIQTDLEPPHLKARQAQVVHDITDRGLCGAALVFDHLAGPDQRLRLDHPHAPPDSVSEQSQPVQVSMPSTLAQQLQIIAIGVYQNLQKATQRRRVACRQALQLAHVQRPHAKGSHTLAGQERTQPCHRQGLGQAPVHACRKTALRVHCSPSDRQPKDHHRKTLSPIFMQTQRTGESPAIHTWHFAVAQYYVEWRFEAHSQRPPTVFCLGDGMAQTLQLKRQQQTSRRVPIHHQHAQTPGIWLWLIM